MVRSGATHVPNAAAVRVWLWPRWREQRPQLPDRWSHWRTAGSSCMRRRGRGGARMREATPGHAIRTGCGPFRLRIELPHANVICACDVRRRAVFEQQARALNAGAGLLIASHGSVPAAPRPQAVIATLRTIQAVPRRGVARAGAGWLCGGSG